MRPVAVRLALLPRRLRAAALAAALPWADRGELSGFAHAGSTLRDRVLHPTLARAMLARWSEIDPEPRAAFEARWPAELRRAALGALRGCDGPAIAGACDLLADCDGGADASETLSALAHAVGGCDDPAGQAALAGAIAALAPGAPRGVAERALIASAAAFGDHRSIAPLEVLLAMTDRPGPNLRAWLDRADEPAHLGLRSAVRRLPLAARARNAVAWVAWAGLRGPALTILESMRDDRSRAAAWDRCGLLRVRGRGLKLARVRATSGLLPPSADWTALDAGQARAAARFINGTPRDHSMRLAAARGLLPHGDAAARMVAVHGLRGVAPSREVDGILAEAALDADGRIACAALSQLGSAASARRRATIVPALESAARAGAPAASSLARELLGALDPGGAAQPASRWWSPVAEMHARRADPDRLIARLRDALRSGDRDRSAWAIACAGRLGLAPAVEEELLACASGPDGHLASAAVRAIGTLASHAAACALEDAMRSLDPRTRSNALEAAWRAQRRGVRITDHLHDTDHRTAASAVRICLKASPGAPGALRALGALLDDDRAPARRSGLWVCRRLRIHSAAPHIARLADDDPDPGVRWSAVQTAHRLRVHANLRGGSERAA